MAYVLACHLLLTMVRPSNNWYTAVRLTFCLVILFPVPSRIITGLSQGQSTDTSHNITITLPLTEYRPEQLLILSTASAPEDDVIVLTNYSSPGMQNTVVFTGLSQAITYNFTIRIILHSNHTVDVVPPVSGMFMTIKTSIIGK